MSVNIEISKSTCIKCTKCVKVCPADIFTQETTKGEIGIQNVNYCISCGHCVAICPEDCIDHSCFPDHKIHVIDRLLLPKSDQVMELIKSRRSNRMLSKKEISSDKLQQILEAAHRAPTASNGQLLEYTLITDSKKLHKIEELTVSFFAGMVKKLTNPFIKPIIKLFKPEYLRFIPIVQRMQVDLKEDKSPILRGATALLLIHTSPKAMFGSADANLAYQNASLMAESLGISQIFTGYLCATVQRDKKHRIEKELNIQGVIHAGMALGIPSTLFSKYIDKKEIKVNYI